MTTKDQAMEVQQQEEAPTEEMERTRSRRTFIPKADIYETDKEIIMLKSLRASAFWPISPAPTRRRSTSLWKRISFRSPPTSNPYARTDMKLRTPSTRREITNAASACPMKSTGMGSRLR